MQTMRVVLVGGAAIGVSLALAGAGPAPGAPPAC